MYQWLKSAFWLIPIWRRNYKSRTGNSIASWLSRWTNKSL